MKTRIRRLAAGIFCGGLLSPRGWLLRAAALLALFGAMHLLGWRDDTRILSGTATPGVAGAGASILRGIAYGLAYFAAVLVCPILILAAGAYALLARVLPRRGALDNRRPSAEPS